MTSGRATPTPSPIHHLVALVTVIMVFAIGYAVLSDGHPHEDAYILFTYAENAAHGHGIVFHPGGPHTEGATDFLWLVLLTALVSLGVDVAIAAAMLNAAGAYACAIVLARYTGAGRARDPIAWILPPMIALSPLAAASYGGFSTLAYGGLCLVLVDRLLGWTRRSVVLVPALALVVALFRPDGVVVGGAVVVLGLLTARRAGDARRYAIATAACGAVAVVYMIWRTTYFGELLPLPLIVKGLHGSAWDGIRSNLSWAAGQAALVCVAALAWVLADPEARRRWERAAIPFALLVGVLGVTTPSQNVAFRLQGPATAFLLLVFGAFVAGARRGSAPTSRLVSILLVATTVSLGHAMALARELRVLTTPQYINTFPFELRRALGPDVSLAVSEAGRLPFWMRCRTLDLVGLNSAEVAGHGADEHLLDAFGPDIVLVHTADTLTPLVGVGAPVHEIDLEHLRRLIRPDFARLSLDGLSPVQRAPIAVYRALVAAPGRYRLFLVRYGERYHHLYAVRGLLADRVKSLLEGSSVDSAHRSYLDLRGR